MQWSDFIVHEVEFDADQKMAIAFIISTNTGRPTMERFKVPRELVISSMKDRLTYIVGLDHRSDALEQVKFLSLVEVGGELYIRTDEQLEDCDYLEGLTPPKFRGN